MRDSQLTLPDGRQLAYTEVGATTGPVVCYFHGAPTSRLDLVPFDDDLRGHEVRVVSPDRPGYGGSSPHPDRRIEDWPSDLRALLDVLGVERCGVIGYSSGGPYAVAATVLLSDRVTSAGVLSSVTDFAWPRASEGYDPLILEMGRAADESAAISLAESRIGADGARITETVGDLAPADTAILADEQIASAFFASIAEAFRQGVVGYVEDARAEGRPWTFDPGTIAVPVDVWHGDEDTIVSPAHAEYNAQIIPTATLRLLEGHGHMSMVRELVALTDIVAEPLR